MSSNAFTDSRCTSGDWLLIALVTVGEGSGVAMGMLYLSLAVFAEDNVLDFLHKALLLGTIVSSSAGASSMRTGSRAMASC